MNLWIFSDNSKHFSTNFNSWHNKSTKIFWISIVDSSSPFFESGIILFFFGEIIPKNSSKFIEKSFFLSKLWINFLRFFSENEILLSLRRYLKSLRVKKFLEFLSSKANNFFAEKDGVEYNLERIFSFDTNISDYCNY